MFSKFFRNTLLMPILCATVLLALACDKTPDVTPEPVENLQAKKPPVVDTPRTEKAGETDDKKPAAGVQSTTAALRDQFQKEAANSITIENAEKVLSDIEHELNEELAELERNTPPTSAN